MRSEEIVELIGRTDWNSVFSSFRGEIEQVPPMYSAKKIDGKKLYEHARKGVEVERKAVKVTIHQLEIVDDPQIRTPHSALRVRIVCSAGTYIRTLAEDIGRRLGSAAHLAELRRTRAGKFEIGQSVTLDVLRDLPDPTSALIEMEQAVSHLRNIVLNDDRIDKTKNGLPTRITDTTFKDGEAIQMIDTSDKLVAIGFYNEAENIVQPKVVLV